jgi:UDP-glucose 4-epimerase
MKKILILGGIGFIGSSLVDSFLKDNYIVTVLSQSEIALNGGRAARYIKMEYTQENFLNFLGKNTFDVIHFLSGNPHPSYSQNKPLVDIDLTLKPMLSMLETLESISYVGTIWFSSSVAVYGKCPDEFLSEESECIPISNYGIAKLSIENYIKLYADAHNIKGGVYRIFSTYGEKLQRQVIYDNIIKIRKNPEEIKIFSPKESARDFSYVEDQALAIKFLSDNVIPQGDIFNIGSGKSYRILDVVGLIAKIMNYRGKITLQENARAFDGLSWTADVSKINSLGYKQKYSLEDGLNKIIIP